MGELIVDRETLRIEYFRAERVGAPLVYIFTPSLNRSLEGNKYGGEFILRSGFAVVAIKSSVDEWFQNVQPEDLARTAAHVSGLGHKEILAYGSSMGGYGALCFLSELGIQRALLISPQFSIREDFDRRWATLAKSIQWWKEARANERLLGNLAIEVIYDPFDADCLHAKKIQDEFPGVHLIPLPFSGHPATFFLNDLGLLKESILELLAQGSFDFKKVRAQRLNSKTYLRSLGGKLSKTGRNKVACVVFDKLLEKIDIGYDDYLLAANVFVKAAEPYKALAVLNKAIVIQGRSAQLYYARSHVLAGMGYLREALNDASMAFLYDSDSPDVLAWRGNILIQLKLYLEAVVSLRAALRMNPNSSVFHELLAQALESLGEVELAGLQREKGKMISISLDR